MQALCARIERADIEGLTGIMPAYASVLFRFDPDAWREHDGSDPHAALWQPCARMCKQSAHGQPGRGIAGHTAPAAGVL